MRLVVVTAAARWSYIDQKGSFVKSGFPKTAPFIVLLMAVSFSARSQELDSAAAGSPRKVRAEKHCLARSEVAGAPGTQISNPDCYPSFSEAIYAATDGAVFLPPDESVENQLEVLRTELDSIANASTTGSGSVILGVDYEHANYGGSTYTYLGPTGCNSATSHSFSTITAGFDNIVSSTRGYSGCNRNILYEQSNFGGATLTCSSNCSGLGVMNDAASSRRFQAYCGETSCVIPDGLYISHFTGTSCNGNEYYHVAYDNFAYQCRPDTNSGTAMCGTTQQTVTVYSYVFLGQCYPNWWPSGNQLSNMVRVYR